MSARAIAIRSQTNSGFEPYADLNITPLIDVMLVLLVMMILSIPTMTHKVPLNLPQPIERTLNSPPPVIHLIDLDAAGTVAWDGTPVDTAGLQARLAAVKSDPNVQVQIRADAAARYERFDQTLAVIERSGITKLGFIGNERFKDFDALK